MSVERIAAGLNARDAARAGAVPLASLQGAPSNLTDLAALAERAASKSARVAEISAGIAKVLERFESDKRREFDKLGKTENDSGLMIDHIGDDRRRKMLADTMKAKRKEVLAIGQEERAKLLSELGDLKAKVQAVQNLFSDPVAVLKTSTLGSEKRGDYSRDLATAGPAEIEAALKLAVLRGDRDLGAAAMSRWDSLGRDRKDAVKLSKRDVAQALVGADVARARRSVLVSEISAESAAMEIARVEGRAIPSDRKIKQGMRKRELAALVGETPEGEPAPKVLTGPLPAGEVFIETD